jgi:3-dehydroquinate dehydratase
MISILIVHAPGVDLGKAYEAAAGAGVELRTHEAEDEVAVLAGLDSGDAFGAVIVTPPIITRAGDAYQYCVADLVAAGTPVVEWTLENRSVNEPEHAGPLSATAVVAGFGAMGAAMAVELLAERLAGTAK